MKVDQGPARANPLAGLVGASAAISAGWQLSPLTGRTHQLRVHCAALDFPILGDPIYGGGAPPETLHLHARTICIPLSNGKAPVEVEALVPEHMKTLLSACGWTPALDEAVVAARKTREAEQLQRAAESDPGGNTPAAAT